MTKGATEVGIHNTNENISINRTLISINRTLMVISIIRTITRSIWLVYWRHTSANAFTFYPESYASQGCLRCSLFNHTR